MFMHPNTYQYSVQASIGEVRMLREALAFRLDLQGHLQDTNKLDVLEEDDVLTEEEIQRGHQLLDAIDKGLEKEPCKILRPQAQRT